LTWYPVNDRLTSTIKSSLVPTPWRHQVLSRIHVNCLLMSSIMLWLAPTPSNNHYTTTSLGTSPHPRHHYTP